jgi:hypothetical protein
MQAGEPLARAIAGLVPPRTAELLAGELPSLATRAALLSLSVAARWFGVRAWAVW